MRVLCRLAATLVAASMLLLGAPRGLAQNPSPATGFSARKPVLAAACKVCPWGTAADVVQKALQPYGYDVLVCYNCWRADNVRLVAGAGRPPRVVVPSYIARSDVPDPPDGPVDFGVTSIQNVWNGYHGRGGFAADGPRGTLRLIASIQSPSYFIVAVRKELGITDLSQMKTRRWPVRVIAGSGDADAVLEYYGLSRQAIEDAGGHVGNASVLAERRNFDVVIANGSLGNAPEFNVWYEVSQRFDLAYLQLPDDLLQSLSRDPTVEIGEIPNGLLRGVDRPIRSVVRSGIMVYSRADAPDEFAYTAARALDEHQDLLQWTHLNFSYNHRSAWRALDIPLHPGAARYYREKGYMP